MPFFLDSFAFSLRRHYQNFILILFYVESDLLSFSKKATQQSLTVTGQVKPVTRPSLEFSVWIKLVEKQNFPLAFWLISTAPLWVTTASPVDVLATPLVN